MTEIQSAEQLKNSGNSAFALGDIQKALDDYTSALQLHPEDGKLKAMIHRNRAMVRLRIEDYEGAESDCTKALEIDGADTKSLYRRALAREQLDKIGPAFQDAKESLRLQPKDLKIKELCERLLKANTEKLKKIASTENKVNEMFKLAFEQNDLEQKDKAMTNILVLARDSEEGARRIWQDGKGLEVMLNLVKNKEVSDNLALTAIRIVDELVKNRSRAMKMVEILGLPTITRLLTLRDHSPQILDASTVILQRVFNALAAMDRTKSIKPDPEIADQNKVYIIRLILELEEMLTEPAYSAKVREAVIDLFIKNLMHMDGGIPRGWSWKFTEDRGLLKLLHIATQIPEQQDYPVSPETRQHVAICLSRLHDDMVFDNKRAMYKEKVDMFFNTLMEKISLPEYKVKLCAFLITLLQGPVDVGINLVTNDQVTGIMLQMASDDGSLLHQSLAAELIVAAIAKYERATAILKVGLPVLKKLYHSENHEVKVRSLMGLCKCASAGGDDYSRATMEEEAVLKLAATCKKFLLETEKYSVSVRSYACEGLSYLSLDADVKEFIVDDPLLLQALVSLAKTAGALCVYTLTSIYVNLTNAYDKPKVDDEMVKLAKFAKHHVPEGHPKDSDEFIKRRRRFLIENGAVTACVSVSKTESKSAMEKLARALLAFSEEEDLRGQIISEGGARLCLQLFKEGDGEGKIKAAHALAKLGCAADPNIAFSGQRMYEVVKPMVDLLHPDLEGRSNYDALLTLTNLASVSDSVRKRILKERAVPKIEEYWFMTDHEDLRAAAAECLLNLLFCEDFFKDIVKPGSDRLKLWVLYAAEENDRLAMASSAGFALLTQEKEVPRRILVEIKSWPDVLKDMAMAENPEVQRRCLMGIANMVESDEKIAAEIVATEVFRVLVAITKLNDKERVEGQKEAQRALDAAEKYGLIKPTDRQLYELANNIRTVDEDNVIREESDEDNI